MRSRVTENCWPTSSSVWSLFIPMPKRMRIIRASRGVRSLAVQPINLPIHDLADIDRAIASLAEQPNGGVLIPPDVTIFSLREQVSALLARYRVPAISIYSALTAAGGLVSYGPDRTAMFRQSASYVDRILRGEKPGDLPFQQPTTYRLVINLKAAKALGLTVPDTLLVAANEVIE
jgi:putative ABC transport system substrate-binding protein